MNSEPRYFAHWLSKIDKPLITVARIKKSDFNINGLISNADLVAIMYYGEDFQAVYALRELQERFENELRELDKQQQYQGEWS